MSASDYYLTSIGGYLHDIGKIITNYLYDNEIFKKYDERAKGEYRHARAGSLMLGDYGFPDAIVNIVENHHKRERKTADIAIVRRADGLDASYRAGTAEDKRKKLLIKIAEIAGLDVTRTLHGVDLAGYLGLFLERVGAVVSKDPRLAALLIDGFYREAAVHLRSDSAGDDNISLYAHSKIVAALTSLWKRYPTSEPTLAVIEAAIEERARFMTVDVVEYLAGLHIYAYFGMLGAVAMALEDLGLDPSFHIASESTTRLVVILGSDQLNKLTEYLEKLSTDLDVPIYVKANAMRVEQELGRSRGVLERNANIEIPPQRARQPLSSRLVCDICHEPILGEPLVLKRASKELRLCERCGLVMNSYRFVNGKQVLCIKKGSDGLLIYPKLKLAVTACDPVKDREYLIARMVGFQGGSLQDVTMLVPSVDLHVREFQKRYKYFAGISLERLMNRLLEEGRFHEYVSTANILGSYLTNVARQQGSAVYPLEVLDDRVVLETASITDIAPIIRSLWTTKLKEHATVAILHRGSPGTTYKNLRNLLRRAADGGKLAAVESLDNALSPGDLQTFNELAGLLKLRPDLLFRRLRKLSDLLQSYADSLGHGDEVEKAYLKSLILPRLFEEPRDKQEPEVAGIPLLIAMGEEGAPSKEGRPEEELSKFFDDESKVRGLLNAISFINEVGEVASREWET